jgi:hypothetical protein
VPAGLRALIAMIRESADTRRAQAQVERKVRPKTARAAGATRPGKK